MTAKQSPAANHIKARTGIEGFDEITNGGLPRGRTTLVEGGPGSGKTIMSLQSLVNSARFDKEPGIFVAFHPSVAKSLGLAPAGPGLAECLSGVARAEQLIVGTKIPELFVLTAGLPVSKSTELMSAGSVADLLSDPVFSTFERIIFDSAPVNAVSDALHLVKHSTAICLVVQAGRTTVKAAQRAQAALVAARAGDIGIVLNRVAAARYNPYGYKFRKSADFAKNGEVLASRH